MLGQLLALIVPKSLEFEIVHDFKRVNVWTMMVFNIERNINTEIRYNKKTKAWTIPKFRKVIKIVRDHEDQ